VINSIFLVIGALLATILLMLVFIRGKANTEIKQMEQMLQVNTSASKIFTQEMIQELPEPVQRYFSHAIAPGTPLATFVRLTMRGRIRLTPEGTWMPLQAEEVLSTKGFVWRATAGRDLMQIQGADCYLQGKGQMRFSLWGLIPVISTRSPDVIRSGLGRLAGEFFWLPSALLPDQGVNWRAIDQNTIQANLKIDGESITLTFEIDDQGRLLRGFLPRWGDQTEDKHYAEIPFGGIHQAERTFGGYTIPSRMGAGWWFGTDRYFEFILTTIEQAAFQ
jgi:hypothetical protein